MERAEIRPVVRFRYSGRFGHFLRAEASASALSYPLPPRTALWGLIGAVLGLEKDTPQAVLKDALVAVSGPLPKTHWHRAKLRKDPPAPLPLTIKAGAKGSDSPERATLIKQEWLIEPSYQVTVSLPEPYHAEFVERLKKRTWHYTPCLGLSEMLADLSLIEEASAEPLKGEQTVHCESVVPQAAAHINGQVMLDQKLALQVLRMPREVTPDRVFTHANYLVEREGRPIPVTTSRAWKLLCDGAEPQYLMFL